MNNNDYNYDYDGQNEAQGTPYAFQNVIEAKSSSRAFAVASLVLGILSIVCCCFTYVGLAMAIMAVVFASVSRRKMGYFDPLALTGLILGIIGVVFGISTVVTEVLINTGMFDAQLEEYFKEFENWPIDPDDTTGSF